MREYLLNYSRDSQTSQDQKEGVQSRYSLALWLLRKTAVRYYVNLSLRIPPYCKQIFSVSLHLIIIMNKIYMFLINRKL